MEKIKIMLNTEILYAKELAVISECIDKLYPVIESFFDSDSKDIQRAQDYVDKARECLRVAADYTAIELHRNGGFKLVKTEDE